MEVGEVEPDMTVDAGVAGAVGVVGVGVGMAAGHFVCRQKPEAWAGAAKAESGTVCRAVRLVFPRSPHGGREGAGVEFTTTTIKLAYDVWERAKVRALKRGLTLAKFIEDVLRRELGEEEEK